MCITITLLFVMWFSEPTRGPRDVKVVRLSETTMNVSFTKLNVAEARSLNVTYTVTYSPVSSRKRQEPQSKEVPSNQSYVIVTDLDPGISYDVRVLTSNPAGSAQTEPQRVSPPSGTCSYVRMCVYTVSIAHLPCKCRSICFLSKIAIGHVPATCTFNLYTMIIPYIM